MTDLARAQTDGEGRDTHEIQLLSFETVGDADFRLKLECSMMCTQMCIHGGVYALG